MSIQPCRPKSGSALPGAIWAQFRPKKLYQKAIPAHGRAHFSPGTKSVLANWTVLALIKGAKLDLKIGLYFTHRNGPVFRAKTDISHLECSKHWIFGYIKFDETSILIRSENLPLWISTKLEMDSRFVADEIPVLWNITSRLNENKTDQHMHNAFDIISMIHRLNTVFLHKQTKW